MSLRQLQEGCGEVMLLATRECGTAFTAALQSAGFRGTSSLTEEYP